MAVDNGSTISAGLSGIEHQWHARPADMVSTLVMPKCSSDPVIGVRVTSLFPNPAHPDSEWRAAMWFRDILP
jgi:hypothetical protein